MHYRQAFSNASSAWTTWPCPRDTSTNPVVDATRLFANALNSEPGSAPGDRSSNTGYVVSCSATFLSDQCGGAKSFTPSNDGYIKKKQEKVG